MKFNHLNVPEHWQHYWSRYPEGYTILEALISWVSQVDDMVDNLNLTLEQVNKLQKWFDTLDVVPVIEDIINNKFSDGTIYDLINKDIFDTKADKTALNTLTGVVGGKIGRGEVVWSDITQEVRDIFLGSVPPAIVGKDSVTPETIVRGAVLNNKVKPKTLSLDRMAFSNVLGAIPINFASGYLAPEQTVSDIELMHTPEFIPVEKETEYIFNEDSGFVYRLYMYDTNNAIINTVETIMNGSRIFINEASPVTKIKLTTRTGYQINLQTHAYLSEHNVRIDSNVLPPQDFTVSYWGQDADPDFDFINKQLTLYNGGLWRNGTYTGLVFPKDTQGKTLPFSIPFPTERLDGTPTTNNTLLIIQVKTRIQSKKVEDNVRIMPYVDAKDPNSWTTIGMVNGRGHITFGGRYTVNGHLYGVQLPDIGSPVGGRNIRNSKGNTPTLTVTSDETAISNTDFIGSGNAGSTLESGLYTIGFQFLRLLDVTFKNYKGKAGLTVDNTVGTHSTLTGTGLLFLNNKIGFLSEVRGEYVTISASQFNGNEIAARIHGGNVQLDSCIISNNVNGIEVLAGQNDSHGIISNCQVNHNTGIALLVDGISVGETISGCHFYDATIHVKNTKMKPVRFVNCVIAGGVILENNTKVIFDDCYFPSGYGLLDSVITNTVIEGHGNEIEEPAMEAIFNTY